MKKIHYIETEEELRARGHGFEFHYMPLIADDEDGERLVDIHEPVAWLLLDGWYNNKSKPIQVRIHPVSSPLLKEMGEKPEVMTGQVCGHDE